MMARPHPSAVCFVVVLLLRCRVLSGQHLRHQGQRMRGAVREIGDVAQELQRMEDVEHRVEADLTKVLADFANGTSVAGGGGRGPGAGPAGGALAGWLGGSGDAPEAAGGGDRGGSDQGGGFTAALGAHLSEMRKDLASLVRTINATRAELTEARDAVGTTEKALENARQAERRVRLAERLRDGKVAVNYETGEVSSLHALLSPAELKRLALQIGSDNLTQLEAHLLRESYLPSGGSRRFAKERQRADPAMLHLDTRFLQDMVVLSLATAIGGLLAASMSAPHTLGYMLGGVVVGPSGLDLIRNLEQAETLAQFGSIFLLFSHGLMYSHYYDHRKRRKDRERATASSSQTNAAANKVVSAANKATPLGRRQTSLAARGDASPSPEDWDREDLEDLDDGGGALSGGETPPKKGHLLGGGLDGDFGAAVDKASGDDWAARRTFSHGFVLVFFLGVAFAVLAHALGTDHSRAEQSLVAAAFSLSSSSTVLSTLHEARLEDTLFGHTVVELLSVQDLVLAPLLALPTAVHELRANSNRSRRGGWMLGVLGGYVASLLLVVLVARRALPRALAHLTHDRGLPPGPEKDASADTLKAQRARRAASDASFGLCVVGYALSMALLGDRLKLSHEAGALFAGLVLVGTPHVDKAKRAVSPLAALFGGMYVASLGLVASPQYVRAHFSAIMGRVSIVVVIKVLVVAPMVYALGFARAPALGAGFVFAQVSEVALFVAARAHHLQLVTRHTYLDVLSTTIVLLAIAPLFIHVLRRVDRKLFLALDTADARVSAKDVLLDVAVAPLKCAKFLFLNLRHLGPLSRTTRVASRKS